MGKDKIEINTIPRHIISTAWLYKEAIQKVTRAMGV